MYFFHEVEVDFIFKREMLSQMRSECREGLYLESRRQRRNGFFFQMFFLTKPGLKHVYQPNYKNRPK